MAYEDLDVLVVGLHAIAKVSSVDLFSRSPCSVFVFKLQPYLVLCCLSLLEITVPERNLAINQGIRNDMNTEYISPYILEILLLLWSSFVYRC